MAGRSLLPNRPAIAAAFAEDDPDFEKYKNRLTEKLHRVEDQRLLSLLDSVRGLSSLAEGWDSGQPFGVNDVVTILSFLNLVSSLESSSPMISDSLNRMRVNSIDLSSGATGPLLSLKLGDALLEDSKPFEDLLKETEIASPMVNDAFFPFIRGIICIANGQNEEAERVLEEAVDRPSVITRFHKESLYGLAMVYRLRFTANKDEGYLRKSAQTFERWLNSNPRITRVRLPASVYGSLDAGQSDLARRFVEYARIQLPPDAAEIFCCELLILNHEKNYLRVLELTSESALADSQWSLNAEHQAFVATMRTNALEKLRLEVEKVLPATGESSD